MKNMTYTEFRELIKKGIQPVIEFIPSAKGHTYRHLNKNTPPYPGMRARIVDVEDAFEDFGATITYDFKEFLTHNQPLIPSDSVLLDENNPYQHSTAWCLPIDEKDTNTYPFVFLDELNPYLNEFLESGTDLCYVAWMEQKLQAFQKQAAWVDSKLSDLQEKVSKHV